MLGAARNPFFLFLFCFSNSSSFFPLPIYTLQSSIFPSYVRSTKGKRRKKLFENPKGCAIGKVQSIGPLAFGSPLGSSESPFFRPREDPFPKWPSRCGGKSRWNTSLGRFHQLFSDKISDNSTGSSPSYGMKLIPEATDRIDFESLPIYCWRRRERYRTIVH